MGSSQWDQLQEGQSSGEDGETSLSMIRQLSLSSILSQPCVLPSGGPTWILKQHGQQAKGKLIKVSWTNLSKKSVETGSSGSLKRVRSPTPLEYALDHPVLSLSKVHQEVLPSHEGSPDFSKWASSDYFGKMMEWLADVDLGKPLSDEEEARSWFGIGWAEEVVRTVSLWYIFHIFLNIFYTCYSHFLCIFHYVLCDFPYDFPQLIWPFLSSNFIW